MNLYDQIWRAPSCKKANIQRLRSAGPGPPLEEEVVLRRPVLRALALVVHDLDVDVPQRADAEDHWQVHDHRNERVKRVLVEPDLHDARLPVRRLVALR